MGMIFTICVADQLQTFILSATLALPVCYRKMMKLAAIYKQFEVFKRMINVCLD